VIRFPNPFTAVSEIVAKAFTIIGDRDAAGGRGRFGVRLSNPRIRRPARAPTPNAEAGSTGDRPESSARPTEKTGTSR